jgi:hypothetical protein
MNHSAEHILIVTLLYIGAFFLGAFAAVIVRLILELRRDS